MGQERSVPFGDLAWTDDAPGIRAREAELEDTRWAVVEYSQGASREDWCEEGHRGYVDAGAIEYEFDDGRAPLRASEGEALPIAAGIPRRGGASGLKRRKRAHADLPHRRLDWSLA